LVGRVTTGQRRVGLFGGTFDPVHTAHVALARAALNAFALDEVRWIPTGQPWQKLLPGGWTITDAVHREAMVRLAIEGEPRFKLDRIEIERQGPSYTLDTVQALVAAEPGTEWVLIIGQDQYAGLHTWRDWPVLLGLLTLAVAQRPGIARQPDPAVQRFGHKAVPLPMLDVSSTAIRDDVAAGRDYRQLVPPRVASYIESHGLYQAEPSRTSNDGREDR
jgi:nicotinate-nucleotide adenylyltransferase